MGYAEAHSGIVETIQGTARRRDTDYPFVCALDAQGNAYDVEATPQDGAFVLRLVRGPDLVNEEIDLFSADLALVLRTSVGGDEAEAEARAAESLADITTALVRAVPAGVDLIYTPSQPIRHDLIEAGADRYLLSEAVFGMDYRS